MRTQDNYVNPEVFDGLRFEKMRGKESESQSKHSLVSLNSDYILFGYGRHAWYACHLFLFIRVGRLSTSIIAQADSLQSTS